jgi:hypothetical protein
MHSPDESATEYANLTVAPSIDPKLPPNCSISKSPSKSHSQNRPHAAVSSTVWKRNTHRAWEYGRRMLIVESTGAAGEASTANRHKPWTAQGSGARPCQPKRNIARHFLWMITRFHPTSGLTLLRSSGMEPFSLCATLR